MCVGLDSWKLIVVLLIGVGWVLCFVFDSLGLRIMGISYFWAMFWSPCVCLVLLCCLADGVWALTNGNGVMPGFGDVNLSHACFVLVLFVVCEAFVSYFGRKCACECFYEMLLSGCWCLICFVICLLFSVYDKLFLLE